MSRFVSVTGSLVIVVFVALTLDSAAQDSATQVGSLSDFEDRFGDDLQIRWLNSPHGARIRSIHGFRDAGTPDGHYEATSREIVDRFAPLFGTDSSTLVLKRVWSLDFASIGSTDKVAVVFDQAINEVPVHRGSIIFLFDIRGRLLAIENQSAPLYDIPIPRVMEREAYRIAERAFGERPDEVRQSEFLIYKSIDGQQIRPAWHIELRRGRPSEIPRQHILHRTRASSRRHAGGLSHRSRLGRHRRWRLDAARVAFRLSNPGAFRDGWGRSR